MKIALAQIEVAAGDKPQTLQRMLEMVRQAADGGADLVIFPELSNAEYFCVHWDYRYLAYAEPLTGPTIAAIQTLAAERNIHVIAPIYLEEGAGVKYNAAVVIESSGAVQGVYRKIHPAARQSLEKIFFKPGSRLPVFQLGGWRVGILICYDTYFAEASRILALRGAEILALPFAAHHVPMWRSVLPTRAYENGLYVAAVNRVGTEPGPDWNHFMGRSLIADPFGKIVVEGGGRRELVWGELERSVVEQRRAEMSEWEDRRPEMYEVLTQYEEEVRGLR
jgi:N-carbamoylputrescine amidase